MGLNAVEVRSSTGALSDAKGSVTDANEEIRLRDSGDHRCVVSLLEHPDADDYVIQNLSRTEVKGELLKRSDLVVAGWKTRKATPKAAKYPMHLRRTYYKKPETPTEIQCERLQQVFDLAGGTQPIGATENIFRCTYLPGRSLSEMNPFLKKKTSLNVATAGTLSKDRLVSLWNILSQAHQKACFLHHKGICFGGIDPRHVVVSSEGRKVHLVNMEKAVKRGDDISKSEWQESNVHDLSEIFRLAIFTQMGLGQMSGPLAYDAMVYLSEVFDDPEYFLTHITSLELSCPLDQTK
ncbi:MAG: hypothetical protein AAGA18_09225 [Verrucomicrobiota bacterium]